MIVWPVAAAVATGAVLGLREIGLVLPLAALASAFMMRRARYAPVVLLGFALGALRGDAVVPPTTLLSQLASDVASCSFDGRVRETAGSFGTLVDVQAIACHGGWMPVGGLALESDLDAAPGSRLSGAARFIPFGDSVYDDARRRTGAEVELSVLDGTGVEPPDGPWLRAASALRRSIDRSADDLPPDRRALLLGLTIGDTDGFDQAMEQDFRRAGLSHLVAVSGSNVAIVVLTLLLVARPLPHLIRYALAALGLLLYVVVVGPDPSVLRAAVMAAIVMAAAASGRPAYPLIVLGAATAVVIVLRPPMVHSVGMQLSVAATAGIVLWSDRIARAIPGPRPPALAMAVTLAAQIAVAPLLIVVFGSVSVAGPVANLLAAPAVAPATVLGLAGGVIGLVHEGAGSLCARLASPAVGWIAAVGRFFARPSWAEAEVHPILGVALGVVLAWGIYRSRAALAGPSRYPWER